MNKILGIFILGFIFSNYPITVLNSNVLLSFPRSGNHYVRFLLEYLSGLPTMGCLGNTDKIDVYIALRPFKDKKLLAHVDLNASPIIYKEHIAEHLIGDKPLFEVKSLIIVVRAFQECIPSLFHLIEKEDQKIKEKWLDWWLNIIRYYHDFKGEKLLIYYEDLIQKPTLIAKQLFDFFHMQDNDRLAYFINNSDEIINKTHEIDYNQYDGKMHIGCYLNTSGSNLNYYGLKLSKHVINDAQSYIIAKTENTDLYGYIKRYLKN